MTTTKQKKKKATDEIKVVKIEKVEASYSTQQVKKMFWDKYLYKVHFQNIGAYTFLSSNKKDRYNRSRDLAEKILESEKKYGTEISKIKRTINPPRRYWWRTISSHEAYIKGRVAVAFRQIYDLFLKWDVLKSDKFKLMHVDKGIIVYTNDRQFVDEALTTVDHISINTVGEPKSEFHDQVKAGKIVPPKKYSKYRYRVNLQDIHDKDNFLKWVRNNPKLVSIQGGDIEYISTHRWWRGHLFLKDEKTMTLVLLFLPGSSVAKQYELVEAIEVEEVDSSTTDTVGAVDSDV